MSLVFPHGNSLKFLSSAVPNSGVKHFQGASQGTIELISFFFPPQAETETGSERHKVSFRIRIQRSACERSCWTHSPLQPYNHRPHIQSHLIHRGLAVGRRSQAVQAVTPHPGFSALLLLLSSRSYLYGWRESPGATELAVNDMLSYCSDTLTDWKFSYEKQKLSDTVYMAAMFV